MKTCLFRLILLLLLVGTMGCFTSEEKKVSDKPDPTVKPGVPTGPPPMKEPPKDSPKV